MRRVIFGLFLAVIASSRFASAAAISVAGADCGTDPLLGLSFTTTTGTNLPLIFNPTTGVACPANNIGLGAIVGNTNSGPGGLYGPAVTSIAIDISNPEQLDGHLGVLEGSSLDLVTFTSTGFILTGTPGIEIGCGSLTRSELSDSIVCSPRDALITFTGFAPGTTFSVSAVNDISAVPEPATLTLLASGLAAAAVRRRAKRAARTV